MKGVSTMAKTTIAVKKMIRPCCENFEPYVAGRPIETIKRELGLSKVIKLASNENPLGPSPKAIAAVKKATEKLYFYPDANCWSLKQALAKKNGVPPDMIMLGAGSDELIELIAKVFFKTDDNIVVSDHAFIRYKMAGDMMGCGVITVPMKGFAHDLDAMAKAVGPKTKAVFIANPNNPTGTYNTTGEFEAFMEKMGALRTPPLVVMDEAYYEYARVMGDYPETVSFLPRYQNLIVLRTFSKIYALAGLRVGYGFASPEIVGYIDRLRPPFNINALAQAAAVESIKDASQVKRGLDLVTKERAKLACELRQMGLSFIPSAGNFLLVDVAPLRGRDVFQQLLKKGVIVRAMDEYSYPNHVRVTIGLPSENMMFVKAMRTVLKS